MVFLEEKVVGKVVDVGPRSRVVSIVDVHQVGVAVVEQVALDVSVVWLRAVKVECEELEESEVLLACSEGAKLRLEVKMSGLNAQTFHRPVDMGLYAQTFHRSFSGH
jgi:hypothetical protein